MYPSQAKSKPTKSWPRRIRIAFLSLIALFLMLALVIQVSSSSSRSNKRWELEWTGTLSPLMVAEKVRMQTGDPEPVQKTVSYSFGPFRFSTHEYPGNSSKQIPLTATNAPASTAGQLPPGSRL